MDAQIQREFSVCTTLDALGSKLHGCCWSSSPSPTPSTINCHMLSLSHSGSTTASSSSSRHCRPSWAVESSYSGRRWRCSNGSPRIILISPTISRRTLWRGLTNIKKSLCCALLNPLPTFHIVAARFNKQDDQFKLAVWNFETSSHVVHIVCRTVSMNA